MSSPSLFDVGFSSSPPPLPSSSTLPPAATRSRFPSQQPPQASHGPIRLSSPRLFRDFFHGMNGSGRRRQEHVPRLPLFRERRDLDPAQLAGAIVRTSRAVESVQEAFQSRRREVVDLTDSPPDSQPEGDATASHSSARAEPDSDFLSRTTHPLDLSRRSSRARGVNTLNEPVFGYLPMVPPGPRFESPEEDQSDSLVRTRNRRAQFIAHHWNHIPRRNTEQEELEAVRRQRENHAAWQQTQARARQLQNQQQHNSPLPAPSSANSSNHSPEPSQPSISSNMSRPTTSHSTPSNLPIRNASQGPASVEAVDLTAVDDNSAVAEILAKQRADAIASQRPDTATEDGRTTLTAYKCPICMEIPINATSTICGHLFCHRCIMETLQWSAKQRQEEQIGGRKKQGVCPVCRRSLAIKDGPVQGRTLVPLELKFTTRKRKAEETKRDKGKGKAKAIDEGKEDQRRSKRLKSEKRENSSDVMWGDFMNADMA